MWYIHKHSYVSKQTKAQYNTLRIYDSSICYRSRFIIITLFHLKRNTYFSSTMLSETYNFTNICLVIEFYGYNVAVIACFKNLSLLD